MRIGSLRRLVLAAGIGVATSSAAGVDEYGPAFGLRSGYAFPIGTSAQQGNLSDTIQGIVPIWLDAGFRFNPYWYVGVFFQYGFGFVPSNATGCKVPGTSCSESDLRFGANVHFHFLGDSEIDPWVGLGFGYEWLNLAASQAQTSGFSSFRGFEIVDGQLGLDFKVTPKVAIGPFMALAVGRYSAASLDSVAVDIQSKGVHEWLFAGLRAQLNVDLD